MNNIKKEINTISKISDGMKIFNKNFMYILSFVLAFVFGLFGSITAFADGPAAVSLYSAGNFVIVSKAGITNTGSHSSSIIGNIGSSPISATGMNNIFCTEINGTIYGVDTAYVGNGNQACFLGNPPLANKTLIDNAVLDMGTAYADAAGRTNPTATELGAGNLGGMTFAPGLYKWSTNVTIPTTVTLSGSANDVWIFQIAGDLSIATAGSVDSGIKVVLANGAKASNVFWQVGGVTGATLGTYSTFNGNILSAKQIIIQTGAVLNGRALAQTQVTLDANKITIPVVSATPAVPTVSLAIPAVNANNSNYTNNNANNNTNFGQQVKTIIKNLKQGDSGYNVAFLQQFLISQGKGSAAQALAKAGVTAYFGELTRAALAEFQAKVGINPPLGNFGSITKEYLSAHY